MTKYYPTHNISVLVKTYIIPELEAEYGTTLNVSTIIKDEEWPYVCENVSIEMDRHLTAEDFFHLIVRYQMGDLADYSACFDELFDELAKKITTEVAMDIFPH